jgi:hypothetical protein
MHVVAAQSSSTISSTWHLYRHNRVPGAYVSNVGYLVRNGGAATHDNGVFTWQLLESIVDYRGVHPRSGCK